MAKKFSLSDYKKTIEVADTPLKKPKYVSLDPAIQSVIGLPGVPLGHITQVFGPSDSGKTSLLFHTAAEAQKQGILPVVIVTEGKVDWDRAAEMGFDKENAIINESCDFLEDVFAFIDKITSDVSNGDLPEDVLIFFDSVGNTLSKDEVEEQKDGTYVKKATMMKAAKVISENMRVLSKKINSTRKVSYPKTVGLLIINQAYTKPPAFPGGPSTLVPYGGEAIWYRASLVLRTKKAKKITAIKDKKHISFGIVAKIAVDKNHLSPVCNSGEFVITSDIIMPNDVKVLKEYKDANKEKWGTAQLIEENQ